MVEPLLQETEKGLILSVKVVLKSARNQIVGWENGMLKVKLNAVPEKGEANRTLLSFLADTWNLPKSHVRLVSGETSRQKKLLIQGIEKHSLLDTLKSL